MKYNEPELFSQLTANGYFHLKNIIPKKACEEIIQEIIVQSRSRMRDTTSSTLLDSYLVLNPHTVSSRLWDVIFGDTLSKIANLFLDDRYYRELPRDLPNFTLNFSIARSSGSDELKLHRDDRNPPYCGNSVTYLQFALALDDVDAENGCTYVVPGSHVLNTYATDSVVKTVDLLMSAGDLVIYDGRLWHGARSNTSGRRRMMCFFGFARWHVRPTYAFETMVPAQRLANLCLREKLLLGLHVLPKSFRDLEQDPHASQRGDLTYLERNYRRLVEGSQ